jgi:hypothetical protein
MRSKQIFGLIAFLVCLAGMARAERIAYQGFEDTEADTWGIISDANPSDEDGSADFPVAQRILTDSFSHQTRDLEPHTMALDDVSVAGYGSVTVRVHISSTSLTSGNGADVGDYVKVYAGLNGGASSAAPDITITGNNNARWSYSETAVRTPAGVAVTNKPAGGGSRDDDGDGYSTLEIGIPESTASVGLQVDTFNGSVDEVWNVDDIEITGNPLPGLVDLDNDGMDDRWETKHFGSTAAAEGGAEENWDGDELTNVEEFILDRNPADLLIPDARFEILGGTEPGPCLVAFPASTNRWYTLQRSGPTEAMVAWSNVAGQIRIYGTNEWMTLSNETSIGEQYYRVKTEVPTP